jgi:hypothetical protein
MSEYPEFPVVGTADATDFPAPPGTKLTQDDLKSPDTNYPVVRWDAFIFWPLSYIDNRVSFAIIVTDASRQVLKEIEAVGSRYIAHIDIDTTARQVRFTGQASEVAAVSFGDLSSAALEGHALVVKEAGAEHLEFPITSTGDATDFTAPEGTKLTQDNPGSSDTNYPVVRWDTYIFWPLSYIDNRVSFAIIVTDTSRRVLKQIEAVGARYIAQINVDTSARHVGFTGQADDVAIVSFGDLSSAALEGHALAIKEDEVKKDKSEYPEFPVAGTGDATDFPAPEGTKLTQDNLNSPDTDYPVVRWDAYIFWPLSYIDNRVSFAVIVTDTSRQVLKQIEAVGARYIAQINVDMAARQVGFTGQAGDVATMSFGDLSSAALEGHALAVKKDESKKDDATQSKAY